MQSLLGLSSAPVAVAFLDAPPAALAKWDGAVPAGCAFWRQAMNGKSFYTVPSDHHNCAVGSHTHGISLPADRAAELEQTIGFMVANNYIRMEEVPMIPARKSAPGAVAYAPVGEARFTPDVVVVAAPPAAAMLLYEAAFRAGVGDMAAPVLGRPGCAAIPMTAGTGKSALSFGCKGNRMFTGLSDSELYFFVPGAKWDAVVRELGAIADANRAMAAYYEDKQSRFPVLG